MRRLLRSNVAALLSVVGITGVAAVVLLRRLVAALLWTLVVSAMLRLALVSSLATLVVSRRILALAAHLQVDHGAFCCLLVPADQLDLLPGANVVFRDEVAVVIRRVLVLLVRLNE